MTPSRTRPASHPWDRDAEARRIADRASASLRRRHAEAQCLDAVARNRRASESAMRHRERVLATARARRTASS